MCQENAVLSGCRAERRVVIGSAEADIFYAHEIEIGDAAMEAAQDVVVEILVNGGRKSQHSRGQGGNRSKAQPARKTERPLRGRPRDGRSVEVRTVQSIAV